MSDVQQDGDYEDWVTIQAISHAVQFTTVCTKSAQSAVLYQLSGTM
jgi:hypothetical protein